MSDDDDDDDTSITRTILACLGAFALSVYVAKQLGVIDKCHLWFC